MTQCIVVQVGQAGNQIGARFWDLALREHAKASAVFDDAFATFFRNVDTRYSPPVDIPVGLGKSSVRSLYDYYFLNIFNNFYFSWSIIFFLWPLLVFFIIIIIFKSDVPLPILWSCFPSFLAPFLTSFGQRGEGGAELLKKNHCSFLKTSFGQSGKLEYTIRIEIPSKTC